MSIRNMNGIQLLNKKVPNTKLIIGVRHPVLFFQSFYNYRVSEMYNKGLKEDVPPPHKLIGISHWKRVSTDLARYELSLMQLGKTKLSPKNAMELSKRRMVQGKTNLTIFLYSIEQLGDNNEERALQFRNEMQEFLGLNSAIAPFPRENVGWVAKVKKFSEHIDICEKEYDLLRSHLIAQSKETRKWIREKFIVSNDVFVGGMDYFKELMESWDKDPCDITN